MRPPESPRPAGGSPAGVGSHSVRCSQLNLFYERRDRVTNLGKSNTDDFRAAERIRGRPLLAPGLPADQPGIGGQSRPQQYDEWRRGADVRTWESANAAAGYEAELNTYESAARRASTTPSAPISMRLEALRACGWGGTASALGKSEDNAFGRGIEDVNESFLSTGATTSRFPS